MFKSSQKTKLRTKDLPLRVSDAVDESKTEPALLFTSSFLWFSQGSSHAKYLKLFTATCNWWAKCRHTESRTSYKRQASWHDVTALVDIAKHALSNLNGRVPVDFVSEVHKWMTCKSRSEGKWKGQSSWPHWWSPEDKWLAWVSKGAWRLYGLVMCWCSHCGWGWRQGKGKSEDEGERTGTGWRWGIRMGHGERGCGKNGWGQEGGDMDRVSDFKSSCGLKKDC